MGTFNKELLPISEELGTFDGDCWNGTDGRKREACNESKLQQGEEHVDARIQEIDVDEM
jgi:hypothetical protein